MNTILTKGALLAVTGARNMAGAENLLSVAGEILLPALIMAGIALILGAAIALCSVKFAVTKEEKTERVEELLAGSNCGGCGRAGCADFAEALVAGKAQVTDCNSTSVENKKKIAEVLGVSADGVKETVMIVRCNGGEACKDAFSYGGYDDCVAAGQILSGGKMCAEGCLGYGSCQKACKSGAIKIKYRCAKVKTSLCTSCGACKKVCPKGLFDRIPKDAKVFVACSNTCKGRAVKDACSRGCLGCGLCSRLCPEGAITMQNNLPVIDYDKCTGCLICAKKCPTSVLKVR